MQSVRNLILRHMRLRGSLEQQSFAEKGNIIRQFAQHMCVSTGANQDEIMERVVKLVKKYDKIDSNKVSETADFQKDLSLDSLDRVELVMAIEEEFSIEIPDEETDKLTCCADIAKFIASGAGSKIAKS